MVDKLVLQICADPHRDIVVLTLGAGIYSLSLIYVKLASFIVVATSIKLKGQS